MKRELFRALGPIVTFVGTLTWGAEAVAQELLWSLESQGNWHCDVVSLGKGGDRVFTQEGLSAGTYSAYSSAQQDPPVPLMVEDLSGQSRNVMVDSAADADFHVGSHQVPYPSNSNYWNTVVQGFDSQGPRWEYVFSDYTGLYPGSGVATDDSGQTVVAALWHIFTGRTTVVVLDSTTGSISREFSMEPAGQLEGIALSADGSTLVLASTVRIAVIDLATESTTFTHYLYGQPYFGSLEVSENGDVVAYGTMDEILVLERTGGTYGSKTLDLASSSYCRRLALSKDGQTLVGGVRHLGAASPIDVRVFDVPTGAMTLSFHSPVPGALANTVNSIDISDDGSRFAVGLYGDEFDSLAELLVFDASSNVPTHAIDCLGTVLDLELSGDGDRIAVVTNRTHSINSGGPGSVDLYDLSSSGFSFTGEPMLGSTVTFVHDLGRSSFSRVLQAPALDTPVSFGTLGTLHLSRPQIRVLALGTINAHDQMETPLTLDGVTVGTTLYFQALGFAPRLLSEGYVELTVLP